MTREQARELFSAAHEGELDAATRTALDAALDADAELAREYAAFGAMLALARGRRADREVAPDLLPRVQRTLRTRSRGRFYADRFAERRGTTRLTPWLLAALLLGLLGVVYLAVHTLAAVP